MANTGFKQPYVIRRGIYGILALVGALLVGFGVAEATQVDQWTEMLERIIAPLLLTLTSGVAGAKANRGSDMKEPVEVGNTPAPSPVREPSPAGNSLLHDMRERIQEVRR